MKTFKGDFDKFVKKIKNDEHFSLSRWGDGELMILENRPLDLRSKGDGEFRHDPNDPECLKMREILLKSYKHQDDNYFIGVACSCCVGEEKFKYMKDLSGQKEENLTWANIFVNSNYQHFLWDLVPKLETKKIVLIANKNGSQNYKNLPFKVERYIPVGTDAWVNNGNMIAHIKQMITNDQMNNYVFLFAAGPFANILTYELWLHSKENTYIDIGSTLDKFLGLSITRQYLLGNPLTLNKVCIW